MSVLFFFSFFFFPQPTESQQGERKKTLASNKTNIPSFLILKLIMSEPVTVTELPLHEYTLHYTISSVLAHTLVADILTALHVNIRASTSSAQRKTFCVHLCRKTASLNQLRKVHFSSYCSKAASGRKTTVFYSILPPAPVILYPCS